MILLVDNGFAIDPNMGMYWSWGTTPWSPRRKDGMKELALLVSVFGIRKLKNLDTKI